MNIQVDQVLLVAASLYVIKQGWELLRGTASKKLEALHQNTLAIVELKVEIKHLFKALEHLPKLKTDVDTLHSRQREIKREIDLLKNKSLNGDTGNEPA